MIQKILIANRGEIARRIIHTCKKMNIKTVAIYSESDKQAPYVSMADEAFLVGPAPVKDSYLNVDKIIEIAKYSEADAIHPGYGFLSENSEFARKCEENSIIFIGPSATVIKQMGSKIEARRLMEEAGVPVVPGITFSLKDVNEALDVAGSIGYPIMLKASAGGGGIGMQIVNNEEDLIKAFDSNSKRVLSFFGDGQMYMEKFIENARHIEIQLLADKHGETVFLWERECSIQRRHQKVIEESPSSFLDEHTRQEMGKTAVLAAQSIGYENAGTIEFLVDEKKNFYFLEMNTRLQVEHPVTEEITKIDIVEQQILIANREHLAFKQEDIQRIGHAIEARIYAEDPVTFYPSPGTIEKMELPMMEYIRHELAVEKGSVISHYYDPMIGKLICHGADRADTIKKLNEALHQYLIEGIKTNIPLLLKIINHPSFHNGETYTNFINKHIN